MLAAVEMYVIPRGRKGTGDKQGRGAERRRQDRISRMNLRTLRGRQSPLWIPISEDGCGNYFPGSFFVGCFPISPSFVETRKQ